jgi:HSP20 family protein
MAVQAREKPGTRSEKLRSLSTQVRQHPLATLREEVDDLVSRLIGQEGWFSGRIVPLLDLSETDTAIQVTMDLPGIDPNDIDIHLSGNTLNVRGESKTEKEEKGRRFHRIERSHGAFSRTVTLPCTVEQDEVAAEYADGVLTITLPKCELARSRQIPVKHV